MAIVLWNKKYTETLAETLLRFRTEKNINKDIKITYAGRLDPMAEGLLILLTEHDVHKKNDFLGLDKVYEIDFFLGLTTDTYDMLGILDNDSQKIMSLDDAEIISVCHDLIGESDQDYPIYSSKPVLGKPLFMWAREGKTSEIIIPKKTINLSRVDFIGSKKISRHSFVTETLSNIQSVGGDFRQREIICTWQRYFEKQNIKDVKVYTIRVEASSGAYMRSLINIIGKKLGTGACSIKIKRLSIGNYTLSEI